MSRILLTHSPDTLRNYYGDRALAGLRQLGEVKLHGGADPLAGEALIAAAADCDLVVSYRQSPAPAPLFERLPRLVAFLRCAIDIRNIDVAAASRNGVLVTQASPGFVPAVVEWIVGAMIDAARHTTDYAAAYRRGALPAARMGRQLHGSTVGIIGYGAIGSRLCEIAAALGMQVLVHDPYRQAPAPLRNVDKASLLREADFVVPLAVATAETENLIDAAALALMKGDAWLINASRGNLVDEGALAQALDQRRIAGAAMDVGRAQDQKPSPDLVRRYNVIATPHIGGLTPQAIEHQAMETTRQAAAIARGELPVGAVNAAEAHRLHR